MPAIITNHTFNSIFNPTHTIYIILIALGIIIFTLILNKFANHKARGMHSSNQQKLASLQEQLNFINQTISQQTLLIDQKHQLTQEHDTIALTTIQTQIQKQMLDIRTQLQQSLLQHSQALDAPLKNLVTQVDRRLTSIGEQVDKRLDKSFEKTHTLFNQVIERIAKIDQAQQEISKLSANILDLQALLADKRSRGALGEVQMATIIKNLIPTSNFKLQHTLSNNCRVDCLLMLPEPNGNICIDAKFPLDAYQSLFTSDGTSTNNKHKNNFKKAIKIHINDIASKYILPGETADSAIMFIPAEAIFAEIHAHHQDLVTIAHKARIWITSPTTMMAILTTASAVLKDNATKQQIHLIQHHLGILSQDFARFQKRMQALAKHINLAQQDVEQVTTSSNKISSRFDQIEKVELDDNEPVTDKQERIKQTEEQ